LTTNSIALLLSIGIVGCSPARALDSLAEAYLEQGKKCFDRGDLDAAKRLFNTAARNAENAYDSRLHKAAIYNNAGEVYRRLYEIRGRSYVWDAEVDGEGARFIRNVIPDENIDNDFPDQTPLWMAAHYLSMSIKIKEQELGTFSLNLARSIENLAVVYLAGNRVDEALALLRKALKIRETKEGLSSLESASTCFTLAEALQRKGLQYSDSVARIADLKESILYSQRALGIWSANKSGLELQAGANEQLALTYFYLDAETPNSTELDQCEVYLDRAESLYKRSLPASAKSYSAFKSTTAVATRYICEFRQGRYFQEVRHKSAQVRRNYLPILIRACRRAGDSASAAFFEVQLKNVLAGHS
jgi:Tfp pilus assembly protein PilF